MKIPVLLCWRIQSNIVKPRRVFSVPCKQRHRYVNMWAELINLHNGQSNLGLTLVVHELECDWGDCKSYYLLNSYPVYTFIMLRRMNQGDTGANCHQLDQIGVRRFQQ